MATLYPGALDNVADAVDLITPLNAAFFNGTIDPVNAIETTLGVNPQGNFPSVAARLLSVVDVNGNAQIVSGTIDGVTIGSITPPNAVFNSVTINGMLNGATNLPPISSTILYAGPTAPTGWLFVNGASVLQSAYPLLYAVIGITFGSAATGYFNLPPAIPAPANYNYIIRVS